jgi:hypothetical protein
MTFVVAVVAQMGLTLLTIRLGWDAIFVVTPAFFAFLFFFGRAFLLSLRRLALLRSTTLRFATPLFFTIFLLFCSGSLGAYIGNMLNSVVFHMPVVEFDR